MEAGAQVSPPAIQSQASGRYCLECSYLLLGLAGNRCPECGREFDPFDPSTYLDHPPERMEAHFANWIGGLERLSWWVIVPVVGALALLIARGQPEHTMALYTPIGIYLTFAGIPVIFGLAGLGHISRWQVARVILISVLAISLVYSWWPLRLTFNWSRPALERLAEQVRTGQAPATPIQVGAFTIRQTEMRSGVVCLWTDPTSSSPTCFANCTRRQVTGRFNLWWTTELADEWQWVRED